jgi:protein-L-isoaspartate(D-aspartate) O-methyltransferase
MSRPGPDRRFEQVFRNIMEIKLLCIFWIVGLALPGCVPGTRGPATAPGVSPTSPILTVATQDTPAGEAPYLDQRQRMIDTIQVYGMKDEQVLRAMQAVPRHAFVPQEYLNQAYDDHPLPIGYGQTISQPFIVAWMTELLELKPGAKVLEIGTGSGYQAAILAELDSLDVYSIEIIPELAQSAARRLQELGYTEVHVKQGDGYYGWEEFAPFDAIIVTAAPDHLPAPLVAQLEDGGCIVIPIGSPGLYQTLWKFVNEKDGLKAYNLGGVSFVPFTGAGAGRGERVP